MVDLAEIQAAYYMVAATGVLVAAVYYVLNIRATQRNSKASLETRQAQLYAQIYGEFSSKEMSDADFELMHLELKTVSDWNRLLEDKTKYSAWNMWSCYYEGIGVMVRENVIDIKWVAELFSSPLIWFWERYKPLIMLFRSEMNYPRANCELEYLYNRVLEYAKEHPDFKASSPVMGAETGVTSQ